MAVTREQGGEFNATHPAIEVLGSAYKSCKLPDEKIHCKWILAQKHYIFNVANWKLTDNMSHNVYSRFQGYLKLTHHFLYIL